MDPTLASVAAAASSAVPTSASVLPFTPDALMNGAATLVGAFFGAMLAFIFQLLFQHRQDRKTDRLSAHRIMFCLLQQTNTIVLFQKDWVAPHVKSPGKFIEIPAAQDFDVAKNLFDFNSFGFLLKSREGRQIMYDLYLAQESYVETLRMINERSRCHRQELQPRMAALGLGSGKAVTLRELEESLGPLICGTLKSGTDQMLSLMPSTFQKLLAANTAFRAYIVKYFRSDDFTQMEFPETYGLVKAAP